MRRILAIVLLALSAVVGLPGGSHAGGPTSVLITQPGVSAGALYYDDAAYDALLALLPSEETRGKELPPGGGADYTLTWMVHDVMPWRFDRVNVARDGTAWVSTTFTEGGTGGWEPFTGGAELADILAGAVGDPSAPEVVSIAPEDTTPAPAASSRAEASAPWVSLTGWRWVVPGVVLGLLAGVVGARRRVDHEPRQVLLTSDS